MPLKKQKFFIILFALTAGLFLAVTPLISQSAGLVPCGGINQQPCKLLDLFTLVATVTNWLIGLAGVFAVYEFINHGFWVVISMGNEEAIKKHRDGLTEAVLGFILVLLAFVLVNTVVNFIFLGNASSDKAKLDLTKPCTYFSASANCVNGQ